MVEKKIAGKAGRREERIYAFRLPFIPARSIVTEKLVFKLDFSWFCKSTSGANKKSSHLRRTFSIREILIIL
jgi:hypothetical protein